MWLDEGDLSVVTKRLFYRSRYAATPTRPKSRSRLETATNPEAEARFRRPFARKTFYFVFYAFVGNNPEIQ